MNPATTENSQSHRIKSFLFARQSLTGRTLLTLQVCMVLSLLPQLLFQRTQTMIYCFGLILWQVLIWFGKLKAPTRLTRTLLILLTIIVLVAKNHTLSGQNSGVELMIMMMCVKYFEIRGPRDWAILQGLCLFALLTIFLYDSSFLTWLYSMLVVFAIFYSMSQSGQQQAIEPRKRFDRQMIKPTIRLMMLALPFTAISFVVLPRLATPLWGISDNSQSAKAGLAETLSPGNISKLSDNDELAFRVKFLSPAPPIEDMYWRGPVFTAFNGQLWSEPSNLSSRPQFNITGTPPAKSQQNPLPHHYQITLEPHNKYWLFAMGFYNAAPENSTYSNIDELKTANRINSVYNYEVTSQSRSYYMGARVIKPESERFLNLPELFAKKTRALVNDISRSLDPKLPYDEQMRDRVLQYFTDNDFYYTRTPPTLSFDPIDQFMFDTRKGYCEHYASAFAFMMRAAGIPARIVTGYHGAEYNPRERYYIVRQGNAHAWTEIWLKNQGWVRVDPTYAIPMSHVEENTIRSADRSLGKNKHRSNPFAKTLYELGLLIDALDYQWDRQVAGFDKSTQLQLFTFLGEIPFMTYLIYLLIVLAIVASVVYVKKTMVRRSSDNMISRYYEKCCQILEKKGFTRAGYEPPNHFADRVGRALPALREPLQSITDIYCQQRYAKAHPKYSKSELVNYLKRINC